MHRRGFLGKAFAAVVGACFLSLDDSDGLYPFQRKGIEYIRKFPNAKTPYDASLYGDSVYSWREFTETEKIYAPYVPLYMTSLV